MSRPRFLRTGLAVLAPAIAVAICCGGDTSEDRSDLSPTDAGAGGAETAGGTGGAEPAGGTGGTVVTGGTSAAGSEAGGEAGAGTGAAGVAGSSGAGGTGGTPFLFGVLQFGRTPGEGYCIEPGQVIEATILFTETGDYYSSGRVFRDWVDTSPDCAPGSGNPACIVDEQFDRMLSAAEVAELAALLEALPEDRCELDPMLACDPCVISTVDFGPAFSSYCCGTQLSPGYDEAFAELVAFLDALAAQSE